MAHRNDSFIFSDKIEDWMSSSEKREERRKRYTEDNRKRKKVGNNNPGYKTLSSMNDQLRA